jgi:hypothetical protein
MNMLLIRIRIYLFIDQVKTFIVYRMWGRKPPQNKFNDYDPYEYGEND